MSKYIKYPRTYHLPWSEGILSDDKVLKDTSIFQDKIIVVTEKMDGENTTLYNDYCHARSIDSKDHIGRHWIKQFHSSIKYDIPNGWRICGENLYAKHSIFYDKLPLYFLVFSIYNDKNICLSWKETKEWCNLLDINCVPELYIGKWDENLIKNCYVKKSIYGDIQEGYVVRNIDSFGYRDFQNNVAKFVRENHVQTDSHWMQTNIIPNKLRIK